jgi:hypothetical protein
MAREAIMACEARGARRVVREELGNEALCSIRFEEDV